MLILPYQDEQRSRRFPFVTLLLIVINVLAFFQEVELARTGQLQAALFEWAVVPRNYTDGISPDDLLDIVRSMFLHGGLLHLLGNMLFLYLFGDNVEDVLGVARYVAFYIISGVAATAAQVILAPFSTMPMIGASGAIAGVLGAYLVLFPGARVRTLFWFIIIFRTIRLPAWLLLGGWFILQFLNVYYAPVTGTTDGVAYAAHVGGFIAGMLLVGLFSTGPKRRVALG